MGMVSAGNRNKKSEKEENYVLHAKTISCLQYAWDATELLLPQKPH